LALGPLADKVYAGKLPYDELPAAFRAADALLLPLDFTAETIEYIRLSLLTKATEFMISGTPIFVFAPREIATAEYLLAHDAAVHCGDPSNLKTAVAAFIDDPASRARVAANAQRRAHEAHMLDSVSERLRNILDLEDIDGTLAVS
jgi:glycosyltransferase involved in cell wall biosynthesis